LDEIDLRIAPSEHIAIVGLSGAGKSTLFGLLLGWHRLAQGQLHLDGVTCGAQAPTPLRRETAWVDPAIQVWNQSFLDNLTYASDQDQLQSLSQVLDAAQLRGVLQKLPDGLQTLLGEGGGLLSGGEGQRVRLARALLQPHARLVLLDEPFRGMDRTQRARFLTEARRWWKDATLLCITHDIEETRSFDRVLVIEGGRIVEDNAPAVLEATASRYRTLRDTERSVRERLWSSAQWRHLTIDQGSLRSTASDAAPSSGNSP
jgi:ATP-binding cassette subfamily B protein